MYTSHPYVIKDESGAYLQIDATTASPFWGGLDSAMKISHYIGAVTIQEVVGGLVFQLNRDSSELNFVALSM
jgi:hypothetical protein